MTDSTTMTTVRLEKLEACPVCGGADIPHYYTHNVGGGQRVHYSQCQSCYCMFLNPRIHDEDTTKYYEQTYREITLYDQHREDLDRQTQSARAKLQANIIKQNWKPKSHLEIGCSMGYLLDEIAKLGSKKNVGVEPDDRFYKVPPASKYRMVKDISELKPQAFDLISMSHSLEHMNHPLDYVNNLVKGYTRPGTLFLIEVPNLEANQAAYRIHHPIAFFKTTLIDLFNRAGCNTLLVMYHGLFSPFHNYLLGIFEVKGETKQEA